MLNEKSKRQINFIVFLRAMAAMLVVYCHLAVAYPLDNGIQWNIILLIQKYVDKPLNIIGNFGFFAVCLFFLISGFITIYIIQKESIKEYVIKKIFRILPPLFLTYFILWIIVKMLNIIEYNTFWSNIKGMEWIQGATLIRYFIWDGIGGEPINAPTWTLFVEVVFYFICFILFNVIKSKPKVAITYMIIFQIVNLLIGFHFNNLFYVLRWFSYVSIIIFGVILYYLYSSQISLKEYALFSIINYIIMITNIIFFDNNHYVEFSYGTSFLYAYLIFIIFLLLNDKIRINKIIKQIAMMSYSLYLIHVPFGNMILNFIYKYFHNINYMYPFIITIAIIVIMASLQQKYLDSFSKKIINKLLRLKNYNEKK